MLAFVLFASVGLPSISQQNRSAQNPAAPAAPFTLTQVWTMDATYSDEQLGVTLRYPRIWKPREQFG
jgi:hypothetical protein